MRDHDDDFPPATDPPDLPPLDLDDFRDHFEVVTTTTVIPRRPGRPATASTAASATPTPAAPARPSTRTPVVSVAAPVAPRPHLAPPLVPHKDPIPDLIPHGSIATFSGASGAGKTTFTAGLVKTLQDGTDFFGHSTNPPPAIGYIAADRPWRDHAQWFARAGCKDFAYYSLADDKSFNWNRLRDWKQASAIFCEALDKLALPPGSVVIVDPLPLFIPGRMIDYKDMAIGVRVLDSEGLQPRQLTLFAIFHISKQKGGKEHNYSRPQDRILGSTSQLGYSETAFYLLGADEVDGQHALVGWVPHQRKPESHKLKRLESGLFAPVDEFDLILTLESAAAALPEDDLVYTTAMLVQVLTAKLKCSARTAEYRVDDLRKAGRLVKVGRGKYQRAGAAPPAETTH